MRFLEIIDIIKWKIGHFLPRNWGRKWLILFFVGCWAIIFRKPLLQGVGNFLIKEDNIEQADAIFILGGNIFDRSTHGVYLYQKHFSDTLIPLGEVVEKILLTIGNNIPDAKLSKQFMMRELNTPEQAIKPLVKGTSTQEEVEAILTYATKNKYQKIIVVSDKFHLRRIRYTFNKVFKNSPIKVMLSGAPNSSYREDYWWKYEQGLIMVNNEYVKLIYYFLKY